MLLVEQPIETGTKLIMSLIIDFYNEIIVGLDYLRNDEQFLKDDFINFVKLIEAVVAFHKYYGGK